MSPGTNENNNESRSFGIRTDAELSLSELGDIIWARKVGIFSFTIFCSVLVVWYALLIPNAVSYTHLTLPTILLV